MSSQSLASSLPPEALRVLSHATCHTTPCGDGEIAWHAWGEGEPLVLFHGGSGSWTHWIRNVEALAAAGRRVLVPDLPGMGDSDLPPGNKDADGAAEALAQGLPLLLGEAPVDLVGFSFGGLTAGLLTAAHPALVRRLVVVGAPGLGLRDRRVALTAWRHLEDRQSQLAAHRSNLKTLMLWRESAVDELSVELQAANVPHDRMPRRRLAMTDALARALTKITVPVQAIYGEQDALYTGKLPELKEALHAAGVRKVLMVKDAGHWVQYEAAQVFNETLLRMLAG